MIQFILNNQTVRTSLPPGNTVLDLVRYQKRLVGTKIGCREGDCGACTILAGNIENEQLVYRSMTSCLMPLGNAAGKHIVTVEGISGIELSPVQQAMVDTNGTQCGFCTPGFIMSLTGFVLNENSNSYDEAIKSIDGNICRCTGYKSIERAAKILSERLNEIPQAKTNGHITWLVENNLIPEYFTGMRQRLLQLTTTKEDHILKTNSSIVIAGGTDLVVQKHAEVRKSATRHLFDDSNLKEIALENDKYTIGASVTVTGFAESTAIQNAFPGLAKYIKLISSTPIRNMATMAGNIANASPIGDMTIFFLALNARIVLSNGVSARTIFLKDFFKGYKQLEMANDEVIEKIIFIKPPKDAVFNFEKVCKRTWLDIASVNSACLITINKNGTIDDLHLSAGGIAPFPKYLAGTISYLKGKKISTDVLREAITVMNEEIAPISDARGTKEYKRLLLRQLFLAHMIKATNSPEQLKPILAG